MRILSKQVLTDTQGIRIIRMQVQSPDIAAKALPGQFVVLMVNPEGERVPLTVVEADKDKGVLTLIFQELGFTTRLLGKLAPGDFLYALAGPLGHATEIKDYGSVIVVGGGVGIAEIYPVAAAFKRAGNRVISILGARNKGLLILEPELRSVSSEVRIATDDGSYGVKGFTTDILKQLLAEELKGQMGCLVYAVGPIPMMQRVAQVTAGFKVRTVVSLNALMIDATGMCGCCRVTVGGKTRFSCVDGPEFDAHLVDWDELITRNRVYLRQEKHICELVLKQR